MGTEGEIRSAGSENRKMLFALINQIASQSRLARD